MVAGDSPRSKVQDLNARPIVCRHHKREVAAHEYQKALLDLWQADNSLCHWLIRYIRTARRVSRNLDLMLLDSSAACAIGSPVSLDKNKSTIVRLSGSTFDLVSTTLPHVDEVARSKGPSATTLGRADTRTAGNKTLKARPNPVLTRSRRVSHLSAVPKSSPSSLLRMPFQAPTSPPPPVPVPQPPRDFMNSTRTSTSAGARFTQQLVVVQVHPVPSHRRDRFQDGLSPLPPRCKSSIAGGGDDLIMEQRRFQDFDELEAAVIVGRHMQSLQKANEFLYRFDREASHAKVTLERFENAREVYRRRVN
ncbi:hypothetical protein BGZ75_001783 [Mortierella antarctica]|nr:hypothetical protein BGZ75_001783 [Mortierella antarctica]